MKKNFALILFYFFFIFELFPEATDPSLAAVMEGFPSAMVDGAKNLPR